jgi:DNA-binding NarL/FixJ family response regulator
VTEQISILVADDHALLRGTLSHRLNEEADLDVVASVGTTDDAIAKTQELKPDIVLMDVDMPGIGCFEAARTIQASCPETRVVFLSAFFNDRYIEQALAAKAWGYIVKREAEETVITAIRKVAAGLTYYSEEVQQRLVFDGGAPRLATDGVSRVSTLSDRELEVLRYLARGLSKKGMAETMGISEHTVHRHTASLMAKLDIHDRVELARFAIREGLAEA